MLPFWGKGTIIFSKELKKAPNNHHSTMHQNTHSQSSQTLHTKTRSFFKFKCGKGTRAQRPNTQGLKKVKNIFLKRVIWGWKAHKQQQCCRSGMPGFCMVTKPSSLYCCKHLAWETRIWQYYFCGWLEICYNQQCLLIKCWHFCKHSKPVLFFYNINVLLFICISFSPNIFMRLYALRKS